MKLQINGEDRDFSDAPAPFTLAALVETLGMKADRVAVELNRDIVPRDRWAETQLHEGDRLEIVHFVGGGLRFSPARRNSLSHPFSTDSLLDLRPSMPKMFETFDLKIVSNISGESMQDQTVYIARSDCLDGNHAPPAAVVGRARSGQAGAGRASPHVFNESSDRSGRDLRTAAQGILAAGRTKGHALSGSRDSARA